MKSKSTVIILLLLAAALFLVSEMSQYDDMIIDYLMTFTEVSPDQPPAENEEPADIQSRYIHMADDLADCGLNTKTHG